jgi:hypothetical protein
VGCPTTTKAVLVWQHNWHLVMSPKSDSTSRLTHWLIDWLTDWLTGWLADWLAGWLAGWLTLSDIDWLAGWLADWLTGWLADWLAVWMAGWLTMTLTLTDWHWLTEPPSLVEWLGLSSLVHDHRCPFQDPHVILLTLFPYIQRNTRAYHITCNFTI